MNSKLKSFCDELESYGGVREFLEFIFQNHYDTLKEILYHYDLEDNSKHYLGGFDNNEIISKLTEIIENEGMEDFLALIKENIDEESLMEYVDSYLGN